MWRALVLALLAFGSAACGAGVRWERPGMTQDDRRRDEAECAAQANRDRSVPVQRITTRPGGGVTQSVELVTIRDFDSGAFDECMRTRGYRKVSVTPPS